MANTFLLKRSSTAANVPTAGELSEGELAINTNAAERRMWSKDAGGTVFEITDHDALTNYVANEHIDWTSASSALSTTSTITGTYYEATALGPLTTPGTDDMYFGGYGMLGDRTQPIYVSNISGPVALNYSAGHGSAKKIETSSTGVTITGTAATTAVTATAASTFSGGINMSDSDLNRPTLEDYGIKHTSPTVSGNAVTVNCTLGNSFTIDMDPATAAVTLTLSNPSPSGTYCEVNLTIIMGTPAYGITWPGSVVWQGGGTAPTLTSTNNVVDIVHLYTVDGGTTWYGTYALAASTGGASTLAGLSDTAITTPADAALLLYDTGTATWRDAAMSGDATITDTGVITVSSAASADSVAAANVGTGSLANGVNSYFTASTTSLAYKVPFMNYTGTASTNASMLHDSGATFTYNPSTNTLVAGTFSGSGASLTSIPETAITDGSVLSRNAGNETISGTWTFSATKSTHNTIFMNERASATTDVTADGQIWVKNNAPNDLYYTGDTGIDYPVAYATYRKTSATALDNANQTLNMGTESVADAMVNGCWYSDNATAYTLTLEDSGTTHFPVGAQMTVWNEGSGTLTINEGTGTTLYVMTGTARTDSLGGCTMGIGGYATIIRKSTTVYLIMGAGITP